MAEDCSDADCSWCGRRTDPADSWLLADTEAGRGAAFCRLEHIVPWAFRGPRWTEGAPGLPDDARDPFVLVRRRGAHSRAHGFASVDEVAAWAKAGGPWGA